ncbi:MAG: hypothetical protein HND52_03300 [Ignavibacteriae bacterium]|nr:hypothetical protein [Ignavibacteriota bacterium]NOG96980.1 hypothetical protein [Ignavibacteriota bacterium]
MESKSKYLIKKFSPYAILLIAAAALMLYFKKNNTLNEFIVEGKSSLVKYYTENLKPLFFKTEITNEDVFNFALHKNIPVDKENKKLLQINSDEESGKSFTIKPGVWKSATNNFEKYVNYLELNKKQIVELDSILELYKEDIYTSILLDDSNTIAVSPNIYHLQKAAYGDILRFTELLGIDNGTVSLKDEEVFNHEKVMNLINEKNKSNEFIVFAEDTVFETVCDYDKIKIKEKLTAAKGNLDELRAEFKSKGIFNGDKLKGAIAKSGDAKDEILFEISSKMKKAYVPESYTSSISIPEVGDINFGISSIKNPELPEGLTVQTDSLLNSLVISISNGIDEAIETKFEFDFNIDELADLSVENLNIDENLNLEEWAEFGLRIDSLANSFEFHFSDSSGGFDYSKFKVDMKKFKKVIKQNRDKIKQEVKAKEEY